MHRGFVMAKSEEGRGPRDLLLQRRAGHRRSRLLGRLRPAVSRPADDHDQR